MRLLHSIFFRALRERRFKYRHFSIKKNNSYVSKNGSLPFSDVTVADLLDYASDTYGGHTALISAYQNISKNYWELRNEAEKLASGFIACGLQKGDKIAIYSPNCYEWSLTQLAAAKSGLILVAINYSCTPQELEYCLKKVRCKAVISFDKLEHQDFYETFNKIIPNLRANKAGRIQSDKFPSLEKVIMMSDENKEGTIRFKDVLESGNRESDIALSQIRNTIQFDDPSHILFTSGTTGYPKAAIINNQKALNNLIRIFYRLGFDKMEQPVICCPVPFFHVFGCHIGTLGMILNKSTTILPSATYNYVKNLNCIEKYECNVTYGTPTMLVDLLRRSRELQMDISTINTIVTGASPIPESLMKDLYSSFRKPNIHVIYGLTECGAIAQMGKEIDCETAIKGFLEPCEQTELKIIDNKGLVVPKNVKGEICSRGYTTFLGYFDDKNKTAESIDKKNWFHTGDIGIMNNKGWVKIVGRIKDMAIRGGENIFLTDVENFLSTHPAVLQVNICGVPDERLGEELCCWIVLKPNTSLTDEDVREYCKGKISHHKIPRYIMFVEDFPKTTTGKIKKHEMTEISKKKLNL